jgi:hypothetical protein
MIELISVILGLVTGLRPIELSVIGPVAQVEIQINGVTQAVLEKPPWVFDCDFGHDLAPQRLVAISRDEKGHDLDRIERLVNVETESAGAELSLIPNAQGKAIALRLSWQSIGQIRPLAIEVTFDDKPLEVENPRRIPLPPYDLADFHFVTATLYFNNNVTSTLQAGFGGELGDELDSRLTAVAVRRKKGRLPAAEKMEGWFRAQGKNLRVHGIEKGTTDILVVRDPSIQPQLDALAWYVYNRNSKSRESRESKGRSGPDLAQLLDGDQPQHRRFSDSKQEETRLRSFALLGSRSQIHFVAPASATLLPNGVQKEIFLHSPSFPAHEDGFGRLALIQPPQRFDVQLADAVALAGLVAHSSRNRRAVLLLLGDNSRDTSRYQTASVRRYLDDLGVPLYVARFRSGGPDPAWGEVLNLGNLSKPAEAERQFRRVFKDLAERLEEQRLVWLVGRHLPQDIELGPAAEGIQIAGR